jgi:hypothetical protein
MWNKVKCFRKVQINHVNFFSGFQRFANIVYNINSSWVMQDLCEIKPCCWGWSRGLAIDSALARTTCFGTLNTRSSKYIGLYLLMMGV